MSAPPEAIAQPPVISVTADARSRPPASQEPASIPPIKGRNATPVMSGEYPSTVWRT